MTNQQKNKFGIRPRDMITQKIQQGRELVQRGTVAIKNRIESEAEKAKLSEKAKSTRDALMQKVEIGREKVTQKAEQGRELAQEMSTDLQDFFKEQNQQNRDIRKTVSATDSIASSGSGVDSEGTYDSGESQV